METCEGCGFCWEAVAREEIGPRVTAGASAIAALLAAEPQWVEQRPEPERWSMLEYAAHVRDVLLTVRDRLVIGLVEDDPGFKPLYRDERVDLGLYRFDTLAAVATELAAAAAMFVRLFDAIDPGRLSRTVQYGWPAPASRTLLWMGQQAVHEAEHHLRDIREDLESVRASG